MSSSRQRTEAKRARKAAEIEFFRFDVNSFIFFASRQSCHLEFGPFDYVSRKETDGGIGDKASFLALVKSGALTHDVMESEEIRIRVYGETTVITARGVSGGKYQGQPFREVERVSCVFVRQTGQWRCVLTHLSRLAE